METKQVVLSVNNISFRDSLKGILSAHVWCCLLLVFVFSNAIGAEQHAVQKQAEETDKRILEQLVLIRQDITNMDKRLDQMDKRLDQMDSRLNQMDKRLDQMDSRLNQMDKRLDQMDSRLNQMDSRIDQMDSRVEQLDKQFWELKSDIRQQHSDINNWLIAVCGGFITLLLGILGLAGIFITHALGYWGPNKLANKTGIRGHGFAEQQRREVETAQEV